VTPVPRRDRAGVEPRARRLFGVAVCVVVTAAVHVAGAQGPKYLTSEPGTWKPWKMTVASGSRKSSGATAAQLKAFEGSLVAFREILRRAPGVAEPRGFSVEVWGYLAGAELPAAEAAARRSWPLAGGVEFGAFPIFEYERGGKTVREDTGETQLFLFLVNDIGANVIGRPAPEEWRALETDIVLQPPATGERAGWPRYDDIVVMTKRTAPLWEPVTLEIAWRTEVEAARKANTEAQEILAKFERDLADQVDPAKRAVRQAEYERLAPQLPDPKAYLKQMAEVEQIREESLRKDLGPTGGVARRARETSAALAAAEVRLGGLSPDDRAAPACYVEGAHSIDAKLRRIGDGRDCAPLARPNPDFFDKTLPRSAPQIVIVPQAKRCYEDARKTDLPSGCPANRALLESLDRQAVLDWLR
jgi:hypothetical protein